MKKRKKERKKTEDEIRIINAIKDYLNSYSSRSNLIRNIDFKEETEGSFMRFVSQLDYGTFEQRIIYYPSMMFNEHFMDVELSFDKSDYIYTFYDIFNLFDIDNFNLYYYEDILSVDEVNNALKDILNATEKYIYEIEKAQTGEYLPLLEKNYETDMSTATGDEDWKEDEREIIMLPLNHPFYSAADGQITKKKLQKLQKKYAKGKLDTIYEKRLLKYLESGKNFERKALSDKSDFKRLYFQSKIKAYALIFAISAIFVYSLSFGIHAYIFKGADMLQTQWELFGIATTLPIGRILLCLLTLVPLALGLILFFGKKTIISFIPGELKNRALTKYEKEAKDEYGKFVKPAKILGGIILLICAVFMFSISIDDIGFYDDHVKFISASAYKICEVPYEELEICRVQGFYADDEDEFEYYENAYYAVAFGNDYYELGDIDPNGEAQKKLDELVREYNKEIKEIKSIDEFYENFGN